MCTFEGTEVLKSPFLNSFLALYHNFFYHTFKDRHRTGNGIEYRTGDDDSTSTSVRRAIRLHSFSVTHSYNECHIQCWDS